MSEDTKTGEVIPWRGLGVPAFVHQARMTAAKERERVVFQPVTRCGWSDLMSVLGKDVLHRIITDDHPEYDTVRARLGLVKRSYAEVEAWRNEKPGRNALPISIDRILGRSAEVFPWPAA